MENNPRQEKGRRMTKKTHEKREQKTVTLFESQIELVQKFANEYYDEDFSQGLRKIIRLWNEKS